MTSLLQKHLALTQEASRILAGLSTVKKNAVLRETLRLLCQKRLSILNDNRKDVRLAQTQKHNSAFIDRLSLSSKAFDTILQQGDEILALPDPIGEFTEERKLKNKVLLQKVRVPLGVIAVIYESRPSVTFDVSALCLKSGNAVVLKCGKEALHTSKAIVHCFHDALKKHHLLSETIYFLGAPNRQILYRLLREDKYIDVIIPRGGYDLVKAVTSRTTIPALYHAEGGARIYVDESANIDAATKICVNAKTNRPGTCNSLDTVVVHQGIAENFLKTLWHKLAPYQVEFRADEHARKIIPANKATKEDYHREFLDLIIGIKIVRNIDEAIEFINTYSKKHSEGIVAHNKNAIARFTQSIDAAALFVNCSTRLHDGGIFGLGAEMGIATGKLHVRGPVGLKELTTFKWVANGKGQLR